MKRSRLLNDRQQNGMDMPQLCRWGMLAAIGFYVIFSALYGSAFAKIHFDVPKLNLPFFVGEGLFLIALSLFLFLLKMENKQDWRQYRVWAIYALYIVIMLVFTTGKWFGLSLRNAAMYYYVFFAMFVYHALKGIQLPRKLLIVPILIMIAACQFIAPDSYFRYSFIVLVIVGIMQLPKGWPKLILTGMIVFAAHPDYMFMGSRTNLVSILVALIFLLTVYTFNWLPYSKRWKILVMLVGLAVLLMGVWFKADHNGVISLLTPQTQMKKLNEWDHMVSVRHYVQGDINAQTYSVNGFLSSNSTSSSSKSQIPVEKHSLENTAVSQVLSNINQHVDATLEDKPLSPEVPLSYTHRSNAVILQDAATYRPLSVAYGNSAFRLFIWKDMIEEIWDKQAWFGFGFGHPQRSKRIETLNWAASEWQRDGWITPHNYFLHLIYRSGIIGLFIFGLIVMHIVMMLKLSIRKSCLEGVMLVSVLIYWLVGAQFLVILELPYYTIPFWSIYGLTWFLTERLSRGKMVFGMNS